MKIELETQPYRLYMMRLTYLLERAMDTIKGEYPESQWPDYKVPEMERAIANAKEFLMLEDDDGR